MADFISPAAEICDGSADNFCQELATLKSVAKDLVWLTTFLWLTVCYFTAKVVEEGGSEAYAPHIFILPGLGGESGR
jgi:hypothetical protein